ncbi:MAG: response regulator transcription factor [Lachnospiraceae bacterium]|nr:response regulator transcription factor [Lachnospiraceae bacterium]
MKYGVLVAEDDSDIVELLSLYLESNGFAVYPAANGKEALSVLAKEDISVALVDIMMPEMNGYDFIRAARQSTDIPIIIISAKNLNVDRVLGLDIGADAYLTKPFDPLEVVAYVKAMLRRYCRMGRSENAAAATLRVGELEFDTEQYILKKNGETVPLTSVELKIMAKLMRNPGRVFTKAQLYECVNGEWYASDDNTMMVHISNIRAKIGDDTANPKYIKTIRGLGYKIESEL